MRTNLRPQVWISGPDPERHRLHCAWRQQKNQAQWRGETWLLEFDDWIKIWGSDIEFRGRVTGSKTMTRADPDLPWTCENVIIKDRVEHMRTQATEKVGSIPRNPRTKKWQRKS